MNALTPRLKDPHIGSTEAIDGLLRIPNDSEQLLRPLRVPEASLESGWYLGTHQSRRPASVARSSPVPLDFLSLQSVNFQVIKIQYSLTLLCLLELRSHLLKGLSQNG
jgi:hypothetical protein